MMHMSFTTSYHKTFREMSELVWQGTSQVQWFIGKLDSLWPSDADGDTDSDQHWLMWWIVAWRHQAITLRWRLNGRDSVSNHQHHGCLFNRLFRRRSKKTSKLCVTGLCEGNSPGTGEFPAQMASNAESVSIWWRHHDLNQCWLIKVLFSLHPRAILEEVLVNM